MADPGTCAPDRPAAPGAGWRWLPFASVGVGLVALVPSERVAAEALLAVFMGSILLVWLYLVLDHAGPLPVTRHRDGTG